MQAAGIRPTGARISEQLEQLVHEFEAATDRAHRIASTVPESLWRTKPSPQAWSVGECIEHLNITSEQYLPELRRLIGQAHKNGMRAPGVYKTDLMGRLLTWFLEPPYRTKSKTAAQFIPAADLPSKESILQRWSGLQSQLISLIREADGLALDKLTFKSPFNARMKYNVYSALRITAAHQRRHLWQAEQTHEALQARR